MRKVVWIFLCVVVLNAVAACSSIDCPLNNTVGLKFLLQGDVTTLTDTLTVSIQRSDGSDSVLLNKSVNTDSFILPLSYKYDVDVYYFEVKDTVSTTLDTVTITKTNEPHFESVDCAASFFHTLNEVSTTHNRIDSVKIHNSKVNYDASQAHLYIYFKSADN